MLFYDAQPIPWVFIEEAQTCIERRPAPHFKGIIADAVELF
jgi:hypothetical protein